jgi:hypothetical protein
MATRWRACTWALLLTAAIVTGLLLATAFLIDPYDTGRSPLPLGPGVRAQGPRTAAASRGRDPAFDAAILGNSHVQILEPAALRDRTGLAFVSLATPGTGPKEALALLDWFLRQRRQPARALVIGIDEHWCTADAGLPNARPFPFWLLSPALPDYLIGLLRFSVLEELPRRIAYLVDRTPERARPDGYWDYGPDFTAQGEAAERARRSELAMRQERGGGNLAGPFPAATALGELLARTGPDLALVLLRPPAHVTALAVPGSEDARADLACKAAFAALAARRPRTALIDWRIDRPENRDPGQFYDHTHYRHGLARLVEADIAAALSTLR